MKLELLDPTPGTRRLRQLKAGDWFVRNAAIRPMEDRVVYMLMHDHTRLDPYVKKNGDLVCVHLGNGRLTSMRPDQPVLQIRSPVELEVKTS